MAHNMRDIDVLHGIFDPNIDNDWMHKMNNKIKTDKLKKPPSLYGSDYFNGSALKYVHFPHIDPADNNKIRFVDGILKGRKDKLTSMRIGRYLTKYFKDQIGSEGDILQAQQQIVYETAPVTVLFADTEDKVEWVYNNGPRSCMSKPVENFQSHIHPCRGYIAGDLQVAYLPDQSGTKVGARAVVWPEKKQWARIYGDQARLKRGLDDLGYDRVFHFSGARIQRIPFRGTYVVPYIDGDARYVQPDIDTGATFTLHRQSELTSDQYSRIESEWGVLGEPSHICGICEDEGTYHDEVEARIVIDGNGSRFVMQMCYTHRNSVESLANNNLYICESCGNMHRAHNEPYANSDERNVCNRCVRNGQL